MSEHHEQTTNAGDGRARAGRGWYGDPQGHARAGRKGGQRESRDREHMREIGRRGGLAVSGSTWPPSGERAASEALVTPGAYPGEALTSVHTALRRGRSIPQRSRGDSLNKLAARDRGAPDGQVDS